MDKKNQFHIGKKIIPYYFRIYLNKFSLHI